MRLSLFLNLMITLLCWLPAGHAQWIDSSLLTMDRIFLNGEFRTNGYGPVQWLNNTSAFTTLERNPDAGGRDVVQYDVPSLNRKVLVAAGKLKPSGSTQPLSIDAYDWSNDHAYLLIFTNTERVWRTNTRGDYYLYRMATGQLTQLGAGLPASSLMFAKFAPDDASVAYVSGFNLWVEDIATGKKTQLTHDGNGDVINGTFDWVYEEEFSCKDGFRWSPDGTSLAYWQVDASDIPDFYMIDNTDSIYSKIIPVQYPKVGMSPSAVRVGVVTVKNAKTTWIKIPGDTRDNYLPRMQWLPDGRLVIQQLNRKQNDYRMWSADARTGQARLVYEEKSDTWIDIDQPDLTMGFVVTDLPLTPDGKQILRLSEQDGWRHLYSIDPANGKETNLSPGNYDIARYYGVYGNQVYLVASPEESRQRLLFRIPLDGSGTLTRVTPQDVDGINTYQIAPDGKFAIYTHQSMRDPVSYELVSLPDHRTLKMLEDNAGYRSKISKLRWPDMQFFQVNTADDITMDGRIIFPVPFDPSKKYPVLFNVYGEPWGQTATDGWVSLWNVYLAQQGYVIINVDPRGTPCLKGAGWRHSVYRQIGRLNAHDQALAAREILKWDFIDPERVAVWGWSGGGSMTLNMMFQYPDLFQTGMSVAPVAYQLCYDNVYQERYMGLPQENMDDFIAGSPVTYAQNLQGHLLLMHGTGDDNVHYQNSEILINALIKYNKVFDFMPYPNRSHGIYEGENTTRHVYTTLTAYLNEHCPPGPK
ncbi:MAG: DPP IV N-terminal domain-containing protein [Saprospiraceae bacterium]|nr:DPP IV N-terminal domain-containing protein [Saprospiraceae bacterium]MCB9317742.1 DPP IV N-terminal domain-containing protein [Lewinellaceae bacterium]